MDKITRKRNHVWRGLFLLTVLVMLPFSADAATDFKTTTNPTLDVSRAMGEIKIDGNLDDAGWQGAAVADNFAEREPGDQTRPPVDTRAMITYDHSHLYIAFDCRDDPNDIRATLTERDQIYNDDMVCVLLDTYSDASWTYELYVNPYGIQGDMLWSSFSGSDESYDLVWESAARVTADGWQVEMAIPFTSLRFPNKPQQSWKIDFHRFHPRQSSAIYGWAAYDRDDQCWACQFGTVNGIEDVRPGRGLEILPSVIAYQSGGLSGDGTPMAPFDFGNDDPDGDMSLGAKYSISSNVTAEATYNPDFSQVEADAAQIDVNTTTALFYPERRPFFQEGSDLFSTIFDVMYTRSINDPQFAAKLIGRMDRTNVAFLSAFDEHTPIIIPFEESSAILNGGKSYSNIFRVRQSLGSESRVGAIVTDRRMEGGGSGTVAGFDGRLRLSNNYYFDWMLIGTHTEEPEDPALTAGLDGVTFDDGEHTAVYDGESYSGNAAYVGLDRLGRHFGFSLGYAQLSPSFRVDNGFEPTNNQRSVSLFTHYTFYSENGFVEKIKPYISTGKKWNYDKEVKDEYMQIAADFFVKGQTNLHPSYYFAKERYRGVDYDNTWEWHMCAHSKFSDMLGFGFSANYGNVIARRYEVLGRRTFVYFGVDFKPVDRLLIEQQFRFDRSEDEATGVELYEGFVVWSRFNLQVTPELSLRLVAQYDDFYETWGFDPLLTYRLNPFSVFYLGSTYDYDKFAALNGDRSEWQISSRQFFMKLQYLFQI